VGQGGGQHGLVREIGIRDILGGVGLKIGGGGEFSKEGTGRKNEKLRGTKRKERSGAGGTFAGVRGGEKVFAGQGLSNGDNRRTAKIRARRVTRKFPTGNTRKRTRPSQVKLLGVRGRGTGDLWIRKRGLRRAGRKGGGGGRMVSGHRLGFGAHGKRGKDRLRLQRRLRKVGGWGDEQTENRVFFFGQDNEMTDHRDKRRKRHERNGQGGESVPEKKPESE